MELRVKVDDDFIDELKSLLSEKKATGMAKNAFSLLRWAADEMSNGRVILSSDPDGKNVRQLEIPGLLKTRKKKSSGKKKSS